MDEKVIVNLGGFFTSLACSYYSVACGSAHYVPFTRSTLITSFPVNKLPNKLAPKVPKSILKNHPLCSVISFSIVLLTPFNKISEFSSSLIILIISCISSSLIINIIPRTMNFLLYASINRRRSCC